MIIEIGIVVVFILSLLFLLKNTKVVKVEKKIEENSTSAAPKVARESLEGEKWDFDLRTLTEFDEKTGKCSQDCLHLLEKRAKAHPHRVAFIWLDKDAEETSRLSYEEVLNISSGFAKENLAKYVNQQDDSDERSKALIILPPSLEYTVGFFALLWSKFVAGMLFFLNSLHDIF